MDRQIVYPGQIPLETDLLNTNRNTMLALGALIGDIFGKVTTYSGLGCVPTIPASLGVNVNPGIVYSSQNVDNTAYSSLPLNQSQQTMKQGILATAVNLATPAPVTNGYSVNYLISAAFLEVDIGSVVLMYYNATNPQQAWSGPGGLGGSNTTTRQNTVALTLTPGIAATTGTQSTPATPTGQTPLYVVTVAYGQSTVTAANISQVANQSILPGSLLATVQSNLATYAADTGTANTYKAAYFPAVTALVDGMILAFEAKTSNTGASTFSPNGLTAFPIVGGAHVALNGTEIVAGGKVELMWKANINSWVVLESTAGAQQVTSLYTSGKINAVNNPNLLFNGSGEFGSVGWTLGPQMAQQLDNVGGEGTYFTNTTSLSAYTNSSTSPQVSAGAGQLLTESIDVINLATVGTINLSFAAFNSSNAFISNLAALTVPNGSGLTRYTLSGTTPAGTAYVQAYVNFTTVTAPSFGVVWRRVKIEQGSTPSLYSQEASIAQLAGAMPVVGSVRNLAMSVTAASATATMTADEIFVETALAGFGYKLANFNKTINLATTGAGGMDTGTAPVSGFVALYAIYNPTTQASALIATNATSTVASNVYSGANMPAGYSASALVGVWPTTAASLFIVGGQMDRRFYMAQQTALNTTIQQTSFTALSLVGYAPKNAKTVSGAMAGQTSTSSAAGVQISGTSAGVGFAQNSATTNGAGSFNSWFEDVPLLTSQTIYYIGNAVSGTFTTNIAVTGYTF